MGRPWVVNSNNWGMCMALFPVWLSERGGIVVYENHMLDSSHMGDRTFMPARFIAQEDDQMHDAPEQYCPGGGLPSMRQQKVDHVRLEDFNSDTEAAISACFVKGK